MGGTEAGVAGFFLVEVEIDDEVGIFCVGVGVEAGIVLAGEAAHEALLVLRIADIAVEGVAAGAHEGGGVLFEVGNGEFHKNIKT